jgi:hypothetical protein
MRGAAEEMAAAAGELNAQANSLCGAIGELRQLVGAGRRPIRKTIQSRLSGRKLGAVPKKRLPIATLSPSSTFLPP